MKESQKRILIILGVIFLVIFLDQASKVWATNTLKDGNFSSFLGGLFNFTYAKNEGAFLSFGSELPEVFHFIALKVFPVIMLLGLFAYILWSKSMNLWQSIAFSSILGGGISNIYDRLLDNGGVVDFMIMRLGSLHTGIFNIADVCIMIGLFMMLPEIIKGSKKEKEEQELATEQNA